MLLVVPVSRSDAHLIPVFEKGLSLFTPGEGHDLLVVGSPNVADKCDALAVRLAHKFNTARAYIFQKDNHLGWPMACNFYWQSVVYHISERYKQPWFWMELDTVPIKPFWLNAINLHYVVNSDHFPFMGVMEPTIAGLNGVQLPIEQSGHHMAAVGVYPANTPDYVINLGAVAATRLPWSHFIQWMVVSHLEITPLIQNNWRTINYHHGDKGIICDSDSNLAWPVHWNSVILDETIIVHGCKDGSLTALLTPICHTEHNEPISNVIKERIKARRKKRHMVKHLTA